MNDTELINGDLQRYSEGHTSPESDLLKKISRDTMTNVLKSHMMSGHLQGRLLAMVSKMIKPKRILEIGTFTGYSALCMAEGLHPDGTLITLDVNEELEQKVRGYFNESGFDKKIDYRIGNATQLIPELSGPFDLVFIDADKQNNPVYFDLVISKVPLGGIIIVDNVLWKGKVTQRVPDKETRNVMMFNDKVNQDLRVQNLLLPIRDGLMIMQKVRD